MKLAQLSASNPELLDVAITSWENDDNFEFEEQLGGGRKAFLRLREFPKYKYILALDGTVAAYRNPYLLASTSALFIPLAGLISDDLSGFELCRLSCGTTIACGR